ncbi:hypothetical protein C2E20_0748 [Micractinium conductrix]|uniref:BRCT domain-containing protein n=1 Tax=Micractinium conductrix TaxID=554055 RepID=A0A2P6VPU0_9CHLO|nr:hypothetical protein C2E20_0748 [Micractinium conductrix]|eukprot:PSC76077.1 hypothetical protein C2E20_0748 [Micractinium conductrix]
MADDQGGPAGWAAGVLLSVTGVPREQRSLVQQLIEAAGGRYSPNLSRRCTHLALPSGEAGAPPTAPSEKLLSGLRNRSKWGLHIVDLRWLLDSARAEGRLDEARFPARLPPGAAAAASHGQEQAPPGSAAAPRPAPSGSKASVMSGGMSLQAADTYQRGSPFCVATMAAAAARAQRPTDPLRNSVTSRPLSSFRQPGTSLQTQSPSVKRSVRWAHPAGTPEGSTAGVAAPSGAVAAAHAAAAAGMLPGEVEQAALRNEDEGRGINFVQLPMTQAGFLPADDLLQLLTAKAAAAAAAAAHAGERSPELATLASQVGNSSGRVFAGMVVVLDAGLPPEEQQQVRAALEQGGGRVAEEGGLCRGATHVVCQPDAALKWLSMGVGIVSPQWVHRSLRSGRQQRCLAVSADTSRHLPAASAATSPSQQQTGSGSTRSSGDGRPPLSSELLQSREARLLALSQLAGGTTGAAADAARPAARSGGGAAHQPATTPSELLGGVAWCVLEPPAAAVLEGSQLRQPPVPAEEDVVIVPDSEDEDQADGGGLCCVSASQAAVQDLLLESPAAGSGSGGAHPQAAAWQASAVLPGVATLTLLLPRDARGELGLDTRCITLPLPPSPGNAAGAAGASAQRQMTAGAMLQLVHDHYSESLGNQEQLQLLQTFPAADSAAAVLRPAFLELQELRRGALLGPRTAFEGLRKATREPTGTVYEVLLGC